MNTDDWVLASFSLETGTTYSQKPGTSKASYLYRYFICKFEQQCGEGEYVGRFVRSKHTRDSPGHIFVYPQVEDVRNFYEEQSVGKLSPPENIRRGQFKLKFSSTSI